MDIDLSTENLQKLCAILNEFALPRAIVDLEGRTMVAWNATFLEQTGYSEAEIKLARPEELVILGESWLPLSEKQEGQRVEFIPCAIRRPFGVDPAHGYAVRSVGNIGYVMLDVSGSL